MRREHDEWIINILIKNKYTRNLSIKKKYLTQYFNFIKHCVAGDRQTINGHEVYNTQMKNN